MADIKIKYPVTGGTALTITLASLTNGSARESTAIDNTTNLYVDALATVKTLTQAGTIASDKCLYVYAYGYDGAGYTANATGSDAGITLDSPTTMPLLGVIPTPAANTNYRGGPWSVARAFGGVLPIKWGLVVQNASGLTLNATGGNSVVQFLPIQFQTV